MPLLLPKLASDLKADFDYVAKAGKNGNYKTTMDAYLEKGDRMALSIHKYLTKGDVVGVHTITNLQIAPGPRVVEWPPQTSPYVQFTAIVTPGSAAPGSTIGPFGLGAHPGATGKIK